MTPAQPTTITSTPSNWSSFINTCSTPLYTLAATVALVAVPCIGGVSDCLTGLCSSLASVSIAGVIVLGAVMVATIIAAVYIGTKEPAK